MLVGSAATVALGATRALAAEPKKIALWQIYASQFDMIHPGIKRFNEAQTAP